MKVLFSILHAMMAAAGDDSHALLQNKKDQQNRDIGPLLDRATSELLSLSDTTVSDAMDQFSKDLKMATMSLLQMPQTEQDALLQRASQGKEFASFVQAYKTLPVEVQNLVNDAALLSPAMNQAYDSLQPAEKHALLQQLDKSTTGKNCQWIAGVRECTTSTRNGRGGTSHRRWSSDTGSGVETVTRNKDGELVHRHTHSHRHDGQGGNAQTESSTQGKDNYAHSHSTAHTLTGGSTATATATGSVAHGGRNAHSHAHAHAHIPRVATSSSSGTISTKDGEVTYSHTHAHAQSEQGAGSGSVTDTNHGPRVVTGNNVG